MGAVQDQALPALLSRTLGFRSRTFGVLCLDGLGEARYALVDKLQRLNDLRDALVAMFAAADVTPQSVMPRLVW